MSNPGASVNFRMGSFYPRYYPRDVDVEKERRVKGEDALCEGEYMKDMGGKNRTVNVSGVVLGKNLPTLNALQELGTPMQLISMQWSGEVLLERCSITGPTRWDGKENSWWFEFRIDAKSTGRDERGDTNYGILSGGGGGTGLGSTGVGIR